MCTTQELGFKLHTPFDTGKQLWQRLAMPAGRRNVQLVAQKEGVKTSKAITYFPLKGNYKAKLNQYHTASRPTPNPRKNRIIKHSIPCGWGFFCHKNVRHNEQDILRDLEICPTFSEWHQVLQKHVRQTQADKVKSLTKQNRWHESI